LSAAAVDATVAPMLRERNVRPERRLAATIA
jgi:hypothetical protein